MFLNKKNSFLAIASVAFIATGCTKLNESLNSNLTQSQVTSALGTNGTALLLNSAYADLATPFTAQDNVFSLEECTTDEALVPTRGGDWDDNGVWRVLHAHTWNADHGQLLTVFNNLNKLNFDATNVLAFNPTAAQAAQAKFLRAFSLYYILDLYGQFPFRNPGDNLLNPPKVYRGDSAVSFIVSELNAALPNLPATGAANVATQNAARVLLMRCYLNHGMFLNRTSPTFTDADMQQVITIGNTIINSGTYKYMANYFSNFAYNNGSSTEGIFAYPNTSGVSVLNSGPQARWQMTFHYNEYTAQAPNAGWNGFATIGDFYSSFNTKGGTSTYSRTDTSWDPRLGGRVNSDPTVGTSVSGIRPGFLAGQQYDQNGAALQDRKGNPLSFIPTISANMIETGSNLEVTGIRVDKYVPDFSDPGGKYFAANSGNWIMIYRYPEVVLMVAEAKMRAAAPDNAGALALVNALRTARGASTLTTMALVNKTNVDDPNTLLAETGRELYWESVRRTNLLRFGVYNVLWQYKTADDSHYNVFPVPTQSLSANPNLIQNPGY